jgi:hypothetical protein
VDFGEGPLSTRYRRLWLAVVAPLADVDRGDQRPKAESVSRKLCYQAPINALRGGEAASRASVGGSSVEDLQARREHWGISSYVIFEPYVDAFAPIVARLAGR